MNKSVNPWVAALVLIFFGSLIILYIWASNHWIALGRLGLAKTTNENHFAVQFGSRIEVAELNGGRSKVFNLTEMNENFFIGDFAFFSNGDVLLSLKHSPTNFSKNIKILGREKNIEVSAEDSLYRCNGEFTSCNVFSSHLPPMNRTFRLFIDNDNKVYMADTSRHKLWLFNGDGNLLATKNGFRFPNQIGIVNGELWVADTNHHAIKKIASDSNNFGEILQSIPIELNSIRNPIIPEVFAKFFPKKYIWPVGFYINSTEIWVLVGNNNLANCRVAVFDHQGKFKKEIALPDDADLISIASQNDLIQLVDMANYRIYQFTQAGDRVEDLLLHGLKNDLEQERQKSDYYLRWEKFCVYIFVVGLIVGFFVAILLSFYGNAVEVENLTKKAISIKNVTDDVWLNPCESFRKRMKVGFLSLLALPVLPVALLYGRDFSVERCLILMAMAAIIIFMVVMIRIFSNQLLSQRLGVLSDRVVLCLFGKKIEAKYADVYWTKSSVLIGARLIPIGSAANSIVYSYDDLVDNLLPRLRQENKIGHISMFFHHLRSDKKHIILFVFVVIIVFLKVGTS